MSKPEIKLTDPTNPLLGYSVWHRGRVVRTARYEAQAIAIVAAIEEAELASALDLADDDNQPPQEEYAVTPKF